ncbi:MAG: DUF2339 domain-containing protein, partial [Candidatus Accumulibacter sp.]|nr:DUF2339 domain-containing protein [Accumulibacter sp.]
LGLASALDLEIADDAPAAPVEAAAPPFPAMDGIIEYVPPRPLWAEEAPEPVFSSEAGAASLAAASPPSVKRAPAQDKAVPPAQDKAVPPAWKNVRRAPPSGPSFVELVFKAMKDWLFGGNAVLRIGVLLLFIGFAFLLRYASERISLPIEFRYAGVATAALALLALGWRLRLKNPGYGLTLQGAGIGVLYLTSFAAMHLHYLLPPTKAFVLLVLFTAAATMLAVLQNASVLASAAALGGFAAPILTSADSGNHVALFSYFALLDTGILLVAWFKAWRVLNLIGFFGTFGIGFAWGIRYYAPEKFASTEPFLALFFLMYVCIGLLFARRKLLEADSAPENAERRTVLRWSLGETDYIDGTLVFGPPLIGFGLQYTLVRHFEFGAAYSALGLGLFYAVLAYRLRGRARVGLLKEICLALSVMFATLAVPLAFDAYGVSMIYAAEGAGIYWLSLVQRRRLAKAFSLALIAAAAVSCLRDVAIGVDTLLSGPSLGAALLSGALLFCHRATLRAPDDALAWVDQIFRPVSAIAGLSFLYLLAPLNFAYENTVIVWALACPATALVGWRLKSESFFPCAVGILALDGLFFLSRTTIGTDTLLSNSSTAAALLGCGSLFCHFTLRHAAGRGVAKANRRYLPAFAVAGLSFLYLVAPLRFGYEYTVIVWALGGLVTILAGLGLESRTFLKCAFGIQLLGGILFLCNLQAGEANILASGWMGLLCAALIGLALIVSAIITQSDAMARRNEVLVRRLSFALLTGLVFLNLALLFVLDWNGIGIGWAMSGLLLIHLGLWRRQRILLYFGVALEAVAGSAFIYSLAIAFAPSGAWAPCVLALAAMIGAWRMHRVAASCADKAPPTAGDAPDPRRIALLSSALLAWGVGWWLWTVIDQITVFCGALDEAPDHPGLLRDGSAYLILFALSLSAALWTTIAHRTRWRALSFACGLPLAVGLWVLASDGPGPFALGFPV